MKTIYKIKELLLLPVNFLSNLIYRSKANRINEEIIAMLMITIKSDVDALRFCDIMENLIDSNSDIEILRNGT